ncbi:MAG TPA: TIR domain-containing protein [Pseudonocardiaceae bacterium]
MSKFTFNAPVAATSIGDNNQITTAPPRRVAPSPVVVPEPPSGDEAYDLAFSFAGSDRDYVEATKLACDERGLRVMYDRDLSNEWWGANYLAEQRKIYGKRALFFVPFISAEYFRRPIPSDEYAAAMWTDVVRGGGYILPVLIDDVVVPAERLPRHIGYLRAEEYEPDELAREMQRKVRRAKADDRPPRDFGEIVASD